MVDTFGILLILLSLLFGPEKAERVLIDVLAPAPPQSKKAETLEGLRTKGGFSFSAEGLSGTARAKGNGRYEVSIPRLSSEAMSFDLSPALKALASSESTLEFKIQGRSVRVIRAQGATYLMVTEAPKDDPPAPLFVIRAAPKQASATKPAPLQVGSVFPVPPTKPGKKGEDFEGFEEYTTPWTVTKAKAGALSPGQGSPEAAAASFFASLMRGDDDYQKALSPNFDPTMKKKLIAGIKGATSGLVRVIFYAKIGWEAGKALKTGPMPKTPTKLQAHFGDYDVMFFAEGNTSATDIVVIVEKVKGVYYVKGVVANFMGDMIDKEDGKKEKDAKEGK